MTEYTELDPISLDRTQKEQTRGPLINPEMYCIHCSTPFQTNCWNQHEEKEDSLNSYIDKVSEISSSSPSSKIPLSQVLSTIFKLNYLKAFKTRTTTTFTMEGQRYDDENLSLCLQCGQVLSQLYQLYNDFSQLGKLDSYLSHMLCEWDQIMDMYQERHVNCDLKERLSNHVDENDDDQSCQDFFSGESIALDNKNNYCSTTTTTTISNTNFDRDPRVLLTRLPEKYLNLLPTASSYPPEEEEEETIFYDNCVQSPDDDDEGDEYNIFPDSVTIKTENDDDSMDFNFTTGDDDGTSSSSTQNFLKNNKHKPPPNISTHLNSTTTTTDEEAAAAAGIRKSKRIRSRQKAVETLDQKTVTEDRPRTKNSGSVTISNKQTKKSKNSHVTRHHNIQNDDSNSCNNNDDDDDDDGKEDDDGKSEKSDAKSQNDFCGIQKMTNKNYFVIRTKYANPCWYCSRTDFPSPTSLREHTRKEHLPQLFPSSKKKKLKSAQVCSRCSLICRNFKSLENHLKRCQSHPSGVILPNRYECTECDRTFAVKSCLNTHVRMVHSTDRPFPCDVCPFKAKALYVLKKHILNTHSLTPRGEYRCAECDKTFKNKHTQAWHLRIFHNPERYRKCLEKEKKRRQQKNSNRTPPVTVCADCGFVDFKNRLAYINHRKTVHSDNMGRNFVCDQCGSTFANANNLGTHIRIHTEDRPFLCQKCGMAFKFKHTLVKHDRHTHTVEGRLRNNAEVRAGIQRRKMREMQLAKFKEQGTRVMDPGMESETAIGSNDDQLQ